MNLDFCQRVEKLRNILQEGNVVFFGGAGVSTESGIPDFRSASGLYNRDEDDGVSPEEKLHISYLTQNPQGFYSYYKRNMICTWAKPNYTHYALANLEKQGKLKAVITQNIDGLHQAAGSETVYELHGTVHRNYCMDCGREYPLEHIIESDSVPICSCGGVVRPDVVMYGEGLNSKIWYDAAEAISTCDTLIVAGTSLTVYPACTLIDYYEGEHLIIINKSPTPKDYMAELVINDSVGEVLKAALED